MSDADHDHRGEYADQRHDHDGDYAREHHLHYDLAGDSERAHRRIAALQDEIDGLRGELAGALERIRALEGQTPQARQLQLEADQAAADLAESGYDRHGRDCGCSYCATDEPEPGEYEPGEYDPGPEADDGGPHERVQARQYRRGAVVMTGPEHWSEADLILTRERCAYGWPHSGCEHEMSLIARAQVHATLALAAATALFGEHPGDWRREIWKFGPGTDPDPDEPTTREIEPDADGWYDVPDPEEDR